MEKNENINKDKIINEIINLSVLSQLLKKKLINEQQYIILKQKVKTF